MERQKDVCSSCGTRRNDWLAPDGKPRTPPPFEAITTICYGCQESERLHEELGDMPAGTQVAWQQPDPDEYDQQFWTEEV